MPARGTRLCARIPRQGGPTSPTSIGFWQLLGRDVRKPGRGPAGRRKHLEDCNDPCQRPWDLGLNRGRLRGPSRKASSRRSCHSSCGHSSCDPSSCESTGFDSRGTWCRAGCSKPNVGSDDGPRGADCSYLWASPCKPQLRAPRGSEATSSATEASLAHSTEGAAFSGTGGKIGANGPGASILFGAARSRVSLFLDYGKGLGDGEGNGSTADGDNGHLRRHRRMCESSHRSWPCFPRTARKSFGLRRFAIKDSRSECGQWFLKGACEETLGHDFGHEFCIEHGLWHDLCCVVQTPNPRNQKPKLRDLQPKTRNLEEINSLRSSVRGLRNKPPRSGSGFTPGLDLGILVCLLTVHSLLSGLVWCGFSGFGSSGRWFQEKGAGSDLE